MKRINIKIDFYDKNDIIIDLTKFTTKEIVNIVKREMKPILGDVTVGNWELSTKGNFHYKIEIKVE